MNELALTDDQKQALRLAIVATAATFLGTPYETEDADPHTPWTGKGKWLNFTKPAKSLDCSGLSAAAIQFNGLKIPHGSLPQFNFTVATPTPKIGDLAFFGHGKDITQIYHVGIVYSDVYMIEAREFDPKASFPTGMVILRPRANWEAWKSFVGYRAHPKLI